MTVRWPSLAKSSLSALAAEIGFDLRLRRDPSPDLYVAGDVDDLHLAARIRGVALLDRFGDRRMLRTAASATAMQQGESHRSVLIDVGVGMSFTSASSCSSR